MRKRLSVIVAMTVLLFLAGGCRAFFQDNQVKNIFDEIYFTGAPKALGYHLIRSSASTIGTGCIKYREEEHIAEFAGVITETLRDSCIEENMRRFDVSYFYHKPLVSISIILKPMNSNTKSTLFFIAYFHDQKKIVIDFRHNYTDENKQINTGTQGKIPDDYYKAENITRDDLVNQANYLLYQYFLPLYFDTNKENGHHSRFSMDNLGDYSIEYNF